MSNELVKTARADRLSVKPLQFAPVSYRPRIGCRMMRSTGCLPPPASCAVLSSCLLAALSSISLIRLALPPRCSCRTSVLCPPTRLGARHAHLIRSSCLLSLRPPASLCLPSPFLVSSGGASLVSLSSRHASRLPYPRFACPLLGVLTVILNAVAMGTVGCGAFVPRLP